MTTTDRGAEILAAVRDLAPTIRERGAEIEAARRIPADLHEQFKDIGIYRMLTPRSHGGDEIGSLAVLPIVEEMAKADGSVAWTEVIGLQTPCVLSLLGRDAFDAIYEEYGPDVTLGGGITPNGAAEKVDGGYLVHGRWPFASGCNNWDLLFSTSALVVDGEEQIDPETGQPKTWCAVFPREQTVIEDSWHTVGLCGTGSHHFRIDEPLFVPEEMSCATFLGGGDVPGIYKFPIIEFIVHHGAIAIGMAQGAIDDVLESTSRRRQMSKATLGETPVAQHAIGTFETAVRTARDSLVVSTEQLLAGELGDDFLQLMIRLWADHAWRVDMAVEVVSRCFRMVGAAAIWNEHPLQRRLRDVFTLAQHAASADSSLTRYGAQLFGQPIGFLG